jgi:hypothetical protein
MSMHEIDYKIFGDDMQYVEVELDPSEATPFSASSGSGCSAAKDSSCSGFRATDGRSSTRAARCRTGRCRGEYREITPPSRLVFTEIFEQFPDSVSVVTADFTDEGGKTRFTATVRYPSLEVRDIVLASGMARGAGISYDRLEDLVAELQRS